MSDEDHLVGPDSEDGAVVSGRPPSIAVAFGLMSSLVAAVALGTRPCRGRSAGGMACSGSGSGTQSLSSR